MVDEGVKSIAERVYVCIKMAERPISPRDIAMETRLRLDQVNHACGNLGGKHKCIRNITKRGRIGVMWEIVPEVAPPEFLKEFVIRCDRGNTKEAIHWTGVAGEWQLCELSLVWASSDPAFLPPLHRERV